MWQSVFKDSVTFSLPWILLCNLMPGLGVTGPQAETHRQRRRWLVLSTPPPQSPQSSQSPIWQGQSDREQSHCCLKHTQWVTLLQTVCGPTTAHTCMHRCRECGIKCTGRAQSQRVLTDVTPLHRVGAALLVSATELQDSRFVVKAIWRVTKVASTNSVHEKDQSLASTSSDWWGFFCCCWGFFLIETTSGSQFSV